MTKTSKNKKAEVNATVARSEDKTIQFNYTIPFALVRQEQKKVVEELAKEIEVPGFRKGKAPLEKVKQQLSQTTLIEKTLSVILPKVFSDSVNEHKIRPAIYPKFEVIKAQDNEDWQVRATTCEMPEINLGDYKKIVQGSAKEGSKIWTPKDGVTEKPKEKTKEEKAQAVINALLANIPVKIPQVMIEQEVQARLARLLERIEKLGLTLDSYLSSIGKTAESLRQDYEQQVRQSVALELILSKIAETENISIDKAQIEATINAAKSDPNLEKNIDTEQQRRIIKEILKRRTVLDKLTSLI